MLTVLKGLPLAYNKDLQEDKEGMFDTLETVQTSLDIFAGMIETMKVNTEIMEESTQKDFSNATELADYLAKKGVPFREAHEIVGKLVLECTQNGIYLQDVALSHYQEINPLIEDDIYVVLSSKTAVQKEILTAGLDLIKLKLLSKTRKKHCKTNWDAEWRSSFLLTSPPFLLHDLSEHYFFCYY